MDSEASYARYLQSLIAGDRRACREIVLDLLEEGMALRTLYTEYFQKALYAIGDLWAANQVSVAVEHMATAITEGLFPLVSPRLFAAEHCGKKAVIACAANEYHQVGARIVADMMEVNGWDAFFLGANTPLPDLLDCIAHTRPDLVGLSLSLSENLPRLPAMVGAIRELVPSLPIIVGGQAFRCGTGQAPGEGVELVCSLSELETYLRGLEHGS